MPSASTTYRLLVGSVIALLTVTGCQTLDDAGRVVGRADLVNDLAARLDRAMESTYSADYQLPGGQTASISQTQKPARSAYTYPGGKLTVTAEATTTCVTSGSRTTCTLAPPPVPSNRPSVTVFAQAKQQGLIAPPVVMGLLATAALDPAAVIEQTDTTVAGRHATCVKVTEVGENGTPFEACVTNEGVLGSFRGVMDGKPVELDLTRYQDSVPVSAFDLPPGAGVVDRRTATPK
ncbi:hypothetical protein [Micromonospora echinofusca]|uniref:Lipoprotein n=1 Tax=Micromonospora echinofusca TaxID=47858 RepID=A0ABS3VRF2_MICEH|nr:hypothetical protein [Micromonospora echinofusca]MBO4207114.1 hypothetical protein [Micromonospora echinofusca]